MKTAIITVKEKQRLIKRTKQINKALASLNRIQKLLAEASVDVRRIYEKINDRLVRSKTGADDSAEDSVIAMWHCTDSCDDLAIDLDSLIVSSGLEPQLALMRPLISKLKTKPSK